MENKTSTELATKNKVLQEVLFVSPTFTGNGDELLKWCDRNSEKIEKILDGEATQYDTVFSQYEN